MSIWNTLFTGSSGIRAFGDGLQVVGDNIANVSTTGFKGARAQFESMLGGQAMNGQREGNGVRMSGPQVLFGAGGIVQQDRNTFMAIDGRGFFAVRDPETGGMSYTRDGQFGLDDDGFLVGSNGRVQVFAVDNSGVQASGADDLRIPPVVSGTMTSQIDLSIQLDYDSEVPANPSFSADDPTSYNFASQINITDSVGGQHPATIYYITSGPGQWQWIATVDGGDIGSPPGTPVQIGEGTLEFDNQGRLAAQSGTIDVSFDGTIQNQQITVDFGEPLSDGGFGTGSSSADFRSQVLSMSHNGIAAAALSDVRVGRDGLIYAMYTDGREVPVGNVAIAEFPVDEGLRRTNSQSFTATVQSGEPTLGTAGNGSRGNVIGGALESSNVDLSEELVTLIAYQRAFQSNARTITTADEILQEVTNLKR